MKQLLLIFLLLWGTISQAQEATLQNTVDIIRSKIEASEGGEKLKWMDSLTLLIEFNDDYQYDSVVRQTIDYALAQEALDIATRNTHDYIYYKNNIIGKPEEGIAIFKRFIGKEKGLSNYVASARLYLYGGDSYLWTGDIAASLDQYKTAKKLALKTTNKSLLGDAHLRIGVAYVEMGESVKASQTIQEAITVYREVKDTAQIIRSKNSLSILYSQNAFYKEAEQERNEAIALAEKYTKKSIIELLYFNASADYRLIGDNENWIASLKRSLAANENSPYRLQYEPLILSNLIIALAANDSIVQAEELFRIMSNNQEDYSNDLYVETLKQMAWAKEDYSKALQYGHQHLTSKLEEDGYVEIMNAEHFLAEVYHAVGDSTTARKHLINYYAIKDSVSSVQKVQALTYYQTLYETGKRDLKIKKQEGEIALLAAKDKVKNQWILFGIIGLVTLFGFVLLIRSRFHLKNQKLLQEKFSQGLMQAQEDERTRISKELHDSVGQQLTLIKKKAHNDNLMQFAAWTNAALDEVRSISRALYPASLKQLGLSESIEQLLYELDEEVDMFFSVDIEDINEALDAEKTLNFYRFIQESVTNAIKHSHAKAISVSISKGHQLIRALVQDNGCGFENADTLQSSSLGLKTMVERIHILKGTLTIQSKKGEGTTLIAQIPSVSP